jgi:hypothetical protein
MVLRGQRRTAAKNISQESKLNRIAHTTTPLSKPPTDGLVSSAQLLAERLHNLREHGRAISAAFRITEEDIWTEMLARSRGQRT